MGEPSELERQLNSTELDNRSILQKAKDWYFAPKSFERSGKLYETLGIRLFKKYLLTGEMWNKYFNIREIKGPSTRDLLGYEKFTRKFEMAHLAVFSIMTTTTISDLADGDYKGAAINVVSNTVVNVYPIMIQRYNRSRILNIVERKNSDFQLYGQPSLYKAKTR